MNRAREGIFSLLFRGPCSLGTTECMDNRVFSDYYECCVYKYKYQFIEHSSVIHVLKPLELVDYLLLSKLPPMSPD